MKKAEQELFAEICMVCLMSNGHGINTKSPEYIKEKMARKIEPIAIYNSCGLLVKSRIKDYCLKWGLPWERWETYITGKEEVPTEAKRCHKQMDASIKKDVKTAAAYLHNPNCKCPQCRAARIETDKNQSAAMGGIIRSQ